MANLDKFVKGTCRNMCPDSEAKMRQKERLIHILEMAPGTEKTKTSTADRDRMVKSFQRSAAGKALGKPEDLRPPKVLLQTVSYLIFDIAGVTHLPWHVVYDFITDRLMAVRQDLVIQNVSEPETISILQPIVRFHAYASYRLCTEKVNNFDPVLNKNHLQECLKKLLNIYDGIADLRCYNDYLIKTRPEFEEIYVVLNLGHVEALQRYLALPWYLKKQDVLNLALSCLSGNFVRTCRLMKKLPPLQAALASLHLPEIRRKALEKMSFAYSSRNLSFPLNILKEVLLYGSSSDLIQDLCYCGICVKDGDCVQFNKTDFDKAKKSAAPRHEEFVDAILEEENLHNLICCVSST